MVTNSSVTKLKRQIASLSINPGVYRFYDEKDTLLYVGKAKRLKDRVSSYFRNKNSLSPRISKMVANIAYFEVTNTPTETDALILENDQIKTLKPRYNILFRDDTSYPYLRITNHSFPRLLSFRGNPQKDCYGPYPNAWSVKESIRLLQRAFRLRTCSDAMLQNRSRPCILHQMGRCSAPCIDLISQDKYQQDVDVAKRFLYGEVSAVTEDLVAQMEQASGQQQYERAAQLRDSINALADIRHKNMVTDSTIEADYISAYIGPEGKAVRLASVRNGRIVGEISYLPMNAEEVMVDDLIVEFINQYYGKQEMPKRIVIDSKLPSTVFNELISSKLTKFITSPRGVEKDRVELCRANALNWLNSQLATNDGRVALQTKLGLAKLERVECFDLSHLMGAKAVGACVVWQAGKMLKQQYRRFKLKIAKGGDDYAGMEEIILRRYQRSKQNNVQLPDLIIIDGGVGQIKSAITSLTKLELADIAVLGMAKGASRKPGSETLITGDGEQITMLPRDLGFLLLQQIRDEAHRFALTFHRQRRAGSWRRSILEDIEGIGPALRRKLVNEFGGIKGLQKASLRDLTRVGGIGRELAKRIYFTLHP